MPVAMKNLLCVCVLLSLCSRANAQLPGMRKYTQLDGLTSTSSYGINQDSNGYLWIGTDNGGVCFDGKKFTSLQQVSGMPDADIIGCSPIGHDRILLVPITGSLRIFDKGRVLTAAEVPMLNGMERYDHEICKYDPLTGTYWLTSFFGDEIYSFRGQDIRVYHTGKSFCTFCVYGNQLLGLDQYGYLVRYNPADGTFHPLYWENRQPICNDAGHGMTYLEDFNGYIAFRKHGAQTLDIYRYIPGDSILHLAKSFSLPPDQGDIRYTIVDRDLRVWLKYYGEAGIVYLGGLCSGTVSRSLRFRQFSGANSLFVDRNGNIWVSSRNNALYFLSRQHFINIQRTARVSLRSEVPSSISGDAQGNMLIGYTNCTFLEYVQAKGHHSLRLNHHFQEGIRNILPLDDRRYLLYGNDVALFNSRTGTVDHLDEILTTTKDICLYNKRSVLIANKGGVDYYPSFLDNVWERTAIFNGRSTAVAVMPDKRILIGTPGGLYLKEHLEDTARKVPEPILGESNITDLLVLPDGSTLAGTNARGLYRYDADGHATAIRNREGKPQHVHSLYRQNDSIYWAATDEGAWCLLFGRQGTLTGMKNYTFYDGLPSNNVNSVFVYRDTAYVATTDGMGVILLNDSSGQLMPAPDIYLNSVQAGNDFFRRPGKGLSLEYNQNNLLVSLSAISYESLGNVHVYYRLYPYQTQWIHTADPDIRFTRLPPGDYVLEAYALNAKGVRSKQSIALEVHISPAFWQTWYFRTGAAVLAALLLLLLLRQWILRREQGKIEKIQQKKRLAELELEAIKAQINPHFIYNCLNSIQYLNYKSEHLQAQHYLDLFARLIRMTMQYSQQAFLSLAEEKEYLSRYLQLEQLRFKEKLRYDIQVTGNIPESTLLPAMLVQPYVENALKHGIAGREDGHISICFEKQNDHLLVTVADNGSGFSTLSRQGALGMRLSGTRALSYNKLFNLSIRIDRHNRQDRDPGTEGAVVQITIPPISYGNILQSDHHR